MRIDDATRDETKAFLHWLADDNFTFLGYREYELIEDGDETLLKTIDGSGLGILRNESKKAPRKTLRPYSVWRENGSRGLRARSASGSRSVVAGKLLSSMLAISYASGLPPYSVFMWQSWQLRPEGPANELFSHSSDVACS